MILGIFLCLLAAVGFVYEGLEEGRNATSDGDFAFLFWWIGAGIFAVAALVMIVMVIL
jgi:hypothetical protein